MAFNDLCDHNVPCGQERQPETTMESHEVLFLLLVPTITLVVPLLLLLSVVALRRRPATDEPAIKEESNRLCSKQDSTGVDRIRARKKRRKKSTCTRKKSTCTRTRRATCSSSKELFTVDSAVVRVLLRVHYMSPLTNDFEP